MDMLPDVGKSGEIGHFPAIVQLTAWNISRNIQPAALSPVVVPS